jgi:glutathione S-transferase
MKLYSSWSPNPQKVLFALKELGEGAELVGIDLFKGEQNTPAFTALNPMQKVPVTEDNGFVLWESNAILAWLGDRHRKLWPQDASGRASALRWMFFEARHISESIGNLWFYESVGPAIGVPIDKEATEYGHTELQKPMQVLDQHLSKVPWMHGGEFTLVDCSIGTDLAALAASKFDWKEFPMARAYVDRIRERKGWRATEPRY